MKKISALILAIFMIMSAIPLMVSANETMDGMIEPCGDNIEWNFDSDTGVLTITGSGKMYDFTVQEGISTAPWGEYAVEIKSVVLPDGLTNLGNYVFAGCSALTEVNIPDSVTKIGNYAFYGCTSLKSVIIDTGMTEFGENPFDKVCVINYIGTESEWNEISGHKIANTVIFEYCEHELNYVEPVYATTTKVGTIGYYECANCKKRFFDSEATVELTENDIVVEKVLKPYYKDVAEDTWYYESVAYCSDKGYFCGVGGGIFNPTGVLTREQFIQVLFSFAGEKKEDWKGTTGFADVPNDEWYSPAIKWARTKKVTAGVGVDTFGLGSKITREQFANLLMNYSGLIGKDISQRDGLSKYIDVKDISDWAVDGMKWAVATGLISGTTEVTLSPVLVANRATATMMFMNYDRYLTK